MQRAKVGWETLHLGGVQLANLFQLNAQAVAKGAFCTQFFQQSLGLLESIRRNILTLEEISKATLNLGFGKQGKLLVDS